MTRPESSQPTRYVFLRSWASAADVATGSTLPDPTAAALDGGGTGTEGDVARAASDAAPGGMTGVASLPAGSARVSAAGAFGFGGVRTGACPAGMGGADCASGRGEGGVGGGGIGRAAGDGTTAGVTGPTAGGVRVTVTGALAGGLVARLGLTGACCATGGGTDCASGRGEGGDTGGGIGRATGDGTTAGVTGPTAGGVRGTVTGALAGGLGVRLGLTRACRAAGGGTDCATGPKTDGRGPSKPPATRTVIAATRAAPPPIAAGRFHPVAGPFASTQSPLSISFIQGPTSGSLASACVTMRSTAARSALPPPGRAAASRRGLRAPAPSVDASQRGLP